MTWKDLGPEEDFPLGSRRVVGGATVFHTAEGWLACENRCPHMGYPMVKATLRGGTITCAWHRWEFDRQAGGCLRGAVEDLRVFPVRAREGRVEIQLSPPPQRDWERSLREAMTRSDSFLQCRAMEGMLREGLPLRGLALRASRQAFVHALAAHRSPQASWERVAIVDAARLAEQLTESSRLRALIHGVRAAGGPTGSREPVLPLPGPKLDLARARDLLDQYSADPSPLGLERVLCSLSPAIPLPELEALLLELAHHPRFVAHPEVPAATLALLNASRWLGDRAEHLPALVAWILGQRRGPPSAEQEHARAWLESQSELLRRCADQPGELILGPEDLAEVLEVHTPEEALSGVLGLLEEGASPASLLEQLARRFALRFSKLALNNGGLWETACSGMRWAWDLLEADPPMRVLIPALLQLSFHDFEARWLQLGRPYDLGRLPETAPDLEESLEALDLKGARSAALHLGLTGRSLEQQRPLLELLLREDQSPLTLHTLVSWLGLARRYDWWPELYRGGITWALDRRGQRDGLAAARFGRSIHLEARSEL